MLVKAEMCSTMQELAERPLARFLKASVLLERLRNWLSSASHLLSNNAAFVLRFYGSVNPIGTCRARSIYLTTLLMG